MLINFLGKQNIHVKEDKMNRRNFLKTLAIVGVGGALPIKLLASDKPIKKEPFDLIHEGHLYISDQIKHMVRRHAEHYWISRKCLLVDELSQGALSIYERTPYNENEFCIFVEKTESEIEKQGCGHRVSKYPNYYHNGEPCVKIPCYEINETLKFTNKEIKSLLETQKFTESALEKVQKFIKSLEEKELKDFIALLDHSCSLTTDIKQLSSPAGRKRKLNKLKTNTLHCNKEEDVLNTFTNAFRILEFQNMIPYRVIINTDTAKKISKHFPDTEFDGERNRNLWMKMIDNPLYGWLWTADILVHDSIPKNSVYITAQPDMVGALPIRQDLATVYDEINNEFLTFEEIGMSVICSYASVKIQLDDSIIQ